MKNIKAADLIERLKTDTRQIILQTNYLLQKDPGILLQQPEAGKWSVVQTIEHLNSYGRYYLPLIQKALIDPPAASGDSYSPGWLGDYFTKSMLPKANGQVTNKMQSPKDHRPSNDIDSKTVLEEFLKQEHLLLELLDKSSKSNLEKIKIPISISRFVKIRLGDTFRFLIAHHQRHFVQVQNTLKSVDHLYTKATQLQRQV
jgi:DinB superfamily